MQTSFTPLVILVVVAIGFSVYFRIAQRGRSSQVDQFFQAGRNIGIPLFTQTTWGSSFAFGNSIFYAAWLGYTMGLSALWIQALWAVGMIGYAFMLPTLIPHTEAFTLHGFLGSKYGPLCRVVASVVSIIGLIILLGFELSFAAQFFAQVTHVVRLEWLIVLVAAVFFATFCSIGGFRANSRTDEISNLMAVGALLVLLILTAVENRSALRAAFVGEALWHSATDLHSQSWPALVGLAFLSLFNFVDMTNWQTVSANSLSVDSTSASSEQRKRMRAAMLRAAGLFIFAPVLTGTVLGYMLKSLELGTNDQTHFMSHLASQVIPTSNPWGVLALAVLTFVFVASSLSGVDSWMLASAQTISWDLLDYQTFKRYEFKVGMFDKALHERLTRRARIVLLLIGVIGAWGVYCISTFLWDGVFNLQFVIFGGGLAMLPCLIHALLLDKQTPSRIIRVSALLSIVIGYGAAIAMFIASLVRGDGSIVEPLPVVSFTVALVVFSAGYILDLVIRSRAESRKTDVEVA